MSARIDNIELRLSRVEEKVDTMAASIADLSTSIERGFHGVDVAFDEQRKYTEFAFSRLEAKMDSGFSRIERKLDQFIDVQIETNQLVDRRLRALES